MYSSRHTALHPGLYNVVAGSSSCEWKKIVFARSHWCWLWKMAWGLDRGRQMLGCPLDPCLLWLCENIWHFWGEGEKWTNMSLNTEFQSWMPDSSMAFLSQWSVSKFPWKLRPGSLKLFMVSVKKAYSQFPGLSIHTDNWRPSNWCHSLPKNLAVSGWPGPSEPKMMPLALVYTWRASTG